MLVNANKRGGDPLCVMTQAAGWRLFLTAGLLRGLCR
jgi:hypothetical protein